MRPLTSTGKMSDPRIRELHGLSPLAGKRILVTRSGNQADTLAAPLKELGAEPVVCPTIEIVPPADLSALEIALSRMDKVDFVILSSVNAVESLFSFFEKRSFDPDRLRNKQIVAVGSKTARAIEAHGLHVDLIPPDFRAEGIVELIRDKVAGKLVFYPKAGLAREIIPAELTAAGAEVLDPIAYTSVAPLDATAKLKKAFTEGLDLMTFTASSTVRNFVKLVPAEMFAQAQRVPIAAIGPLTSQTARELGLRVAVEPATSTLEAMVEAIAAYFDAPGLRTED